MSVDISPYAVKGESGITGSIQVNRRGEAVNVTARETREGWPLLPLLAVETDVNGDLKSTNERGPTLVEILFGLGCSSRSSRKYFFSSPCTISIFLPLSPSKLGTGRRAGSPVS